MDKTKDVTGSAQVDDITAQLVDAVHTIMESQHGVRDEDGDNVTVAIMAHLMIELGGFLQMAAALESGHEPDDVAGDIIAFAMAALEQGINRNLRPEHEISINAIETPSAEALH